MDDFARTCEEVARQSARTRKLRVLAEWFRTLEEPDLARAVRFLSGQPLAGSGKRSLAVGGATLREACLAVTGLPPELYRFCNREVGDTAETLALLMRNHPGEEPLTLAGAEALLEELAGLRKVAAKQALIEHVLRRYRPATLKYLLKIVTGSLRIGVQEKLLEDALALAAGLSVEKVREAANRSGDLAAVAVALRQGNLDAIEAALFHPLDFMLAKPLDAPGDLSDPGNWWVEEKHDGIRCQAHSAGGKVRLFSRGGEDVTHSYPELVLALAALPQSAVLDGELLAWQGGAALPFSLLQQRLARKKVTAALLEQIPVVYVAYDLLMDGGTLLVDRPLEERQTRLNTLLQGASARLLMSPRRSVTTAAELEAAFEAARARGNEGLVLKRRGSLYEGGKRGGNWLKLKRPAGTLDVVITAAEQGRGRRATMLSDYTFAVRDGDRFLNVGKAYSGLTDDEIRELTRRLRQSATQRFGRVLLVKPEIVLEVAFDGIQESPRHKSGFAMRFPRIVRWREDKGPEDADTLERVREIHERSLRRGAPEA